MAYSPNKDRWREPCDLCGGVQFKEIPAAGHGSRALRCRNCGLMTMPRGENRGNGEASAEAGGTNGFSGSKGTLLQSLRDIARGFGGGGSTLVIGPETLAGEPEFARLGERVTLLSEPGIAQNGGGPAVVYSKSLESAPFLPDQFDLIICARPLESVDSPSLLFERCRLWLVDGGVLVVTGLNSGSLPALLWRAKWMRRHGAAFRCLLSASNLESYADRFGYEIRRMRKKTTSKDLARILESREGSRGFFTSLLGPVAFLINLLNSGDTLTAVLTKGGVAVRPLPAKITKEAEHSPGLAPALYSSVRRETVGG